MKFQDSQGEYWMACRKDLRTGEPMAGVVSQPHGDARSLE